ncbi:Probable diacylglycerol pyrophosphate phosphatase 1 Short=DGPP phosphatase; AltName: Full=Phosphatidate phosphatase [Serendipita indica DSM 11827]|uniref:Related to DPP1-diacylglycerol pyrophosphate phosphatase n=1 Tax=Serendipita indica (strain DSM 11827) TaxID=1109443 RepID=G4TF46_SERID|nr:Probable diacylglycerol pyrophosphate phosphatase 1 Short=DGPP phosphatase; AltName: Full=Phosphatidate phosphatase [Serendipita indica DSM 11827]CCA69931.1 related to DPP1-diacylglycerol pyrophosphate phosphatase [Serendipita indica DSM 11827]
MSAPPAPSSDSQVYKRNVRVRRWKLLASYFGDWFLTVALAALFLALENVHGFRRRFSLQDESIQYPFTVKERVPNWLLGVICLGIPGVLMPIVNLLTVRMLWDLHNSWLGLVLSLAISGSITQIFKITAGRPRPDLIARCAPVQGAQNPPVYGLVDDSICTQTEYAIMIDGWRSFSSGHSCLSFAGLGFLSLYLAGKLHLFDSRGQTSKAWISIFPLFGAALVATTRTMDYRHHWQDVLVGAVIGITTAYFAYRQYYPTLESPLSHRPFSPRYAPIQAQGSKDANGDKSGNQDVELGPVQEQGATGVEGTVPR